MQQRILSRLSRRTLITILLASLALAAAAWSALYFWLLADLPPISALEERLIRPTTQIVDRNGRLLYEVLDPNTGKQLSLSLDQVPQACIDATLATEDSRFYLHPGVDPIAIARAALQNYRAGGKVVSGGSTLTQQLARYVFLPPEERYTQSIRRKLREAWLAWRLEQRYSKDEILALYLNQTYYGNFAFGLEAAAQIFFAKPAAHLSRAECALLAGLVQYPTGYNPLQTPEIAKERQLTVLRLMREAGYVSQEEAQIIAAEPLRYRSNLFNIDAPHFVMYVQDLLVQQLGVERLRDGGLRIVTTLDLNLQRRAVQSVRYRLDLLNCRLEGLCDAQTDPKRRVDNAAAVVLDAKSGDILSMVGSPNYFDASIQGNVNAALALRQPGSAIKPFTYAAAFDPVLSGERGQAPLTAATILPDLPATFYVRDQKGGNVPYQPVNYDRRNHGPVSARTALASSYNIPAVHVLNQIGVDALRDIAGKAGISTFTKDYGLALTLGGGEVKLLDLTTAFGMFQDGRRLESRAILDIQSRGPDGEWRSLLGQPNLPARRSHADPYGARIVQPETAYLITDILADPVARQPAFGSYSVLDLPFPAAVKTGTTTDWRDNWTLGYTTERIVGVWVGNADNTPMLDVSGIDGAGPIWHDLMLAAHPNSPAPFTRPEGIVEIAVCAPSGLLPTEHCPRVRSDRFIRGTEPTAQDNQFQPLTIDAATGLIANDETPENRRVERVYWMLPPAYHDWMLSQNIPIAPPSAAATAMNAVADQQAPEQATAPLILAAPTSNTAYSLHPSMPRDRQRIEVAGYTAAGRAWAELRLVKDGEVLATAADATHLAAWWTLTPGTHHFWIEGTAAPGEPAARSSVALVVVTSGSGSSGLVSSGGVGDGSQPVDIIDAEIIDAETIDAVASEIE